MPALHCRKMPEEDTRNRKRVYDVDGVESILPRHWNFRADGLLTLQFIDLFLLAPSTFSDDVGCANLAQITRLLQKRVLPFLSQLWTGMHRQIHFPKIRR